MRGYVLDMESVLEHRVQIAGHATRALEVDGDGPGIVLLHGWSDSADTWRPLLAELGRTRPARDRRRPARASARRRRLQRRRGAPAAGRVRRRARRLRGRAPSRSWSRARRSAAASRCGWPSIPGELRLAASSRSRPTGSSCRRGSTRSRRTRSSAGCSRSRSRCPGVLVRRAAGARLPPARASSHPSETQRAVVDAFSRDGETRADVAALLESGRELAPELSTAPFDLIGIRCPVLLVWGAHDRMLPHTDARMALDSLPTTQVELIEGAGHSPAARGHRPAARAAAAVRHVARKFGCAASAPG